jgi:RNA polymerase primary sigma factor
MAKHEAVRNADDVEQEDRQRKRMTVIKEFIESKAGKVAKAGTN